MDGMITEIERFALNDGPGIRTTVFFKGCNLNCAWCHNPETISATKQLHYYAERCIGCFKCVDICPVGAQKKVNSCHMYCPELCVHCGRCAEICFAGAMSMSGSVMSVEDVMAEIIQDKPYYLSSGGGVTLSGGEVCCQAAFAERLTDACHEQGIPVGIESNLSLPWKKIEPLIGKIDLVMCDIKIADSAEHRKWVGAGNEAILDNIMKLCELGKPFIVRTPMIPGVTDSNENVAAIASFLNQADRNNNMIYYELLNFNPLGESKYRSLMKKNPFEGVQPLSTGRMKELRAIAEKQGVKTRIE